MPDAGETPQTRSIAVLSRHCSTLHITVWY